MMREEFTQRTGFFPSTALYKVIEKHYTEYDGDKDAFCKAYKKNENGLAEKIQHEADMETFKAQQEAEKAQRATEKQIEDLEKALEREQEWRLYEDTSNVQQADYDKLASCSDTEEMSDEEAKALLYDWYGFAKEKIEILRSVPVYEVNRHGRLRKIGESNRSPLYNATDWNYIRFNCGCMCYELQNDNLRPFLH